MTQQQPLTEATTEGTTTKWVLPRGNNGQQHDGLPRDGLSRESTACGGSSSSRNRCFGCCCCRYWPRRIQQPSPPHHGRAGVPRICVACWAAAMRAVAVAVVAAILLVLVVQRKATAAAAAVAYNVSPRFDSNHSLSKDAAIMMKKILGWSTSFASLRYPTQYHWQRTRRRRRGAGQARHSGSIPGSIHHNSSTSSTSSAARTPRSVQFQRWLNEQGENGDNHDNNNNAQEGRGDGEEGQQQREGEDNNNGREGDGGADADQNEQGGHEGQDEQDGGGPGQDNNDNNNMEGEGNQEAGGDEAAEGEGNGEEQEGGGDNEEAGGQEQQQDQQQQQDGADNEQQQEDHNNEQDQEQEQQPGREAAGDDYFDDHLHDDIVANDDENNGMTTTATTNRIDDYYAYAEDPGPPRLFPLTSREVMGYFLASIALTLGASGGIGGGGIVVPVYILVMGLPLRVAVTTGAATVLGGALGSTILNWTRRHPLADRPLIDFDLVLVLEPLILVGTLIGTLCHRLFSEKFLIVLLVLLLSVTAHTTLSKAMRMYQAEKRYIRHLIAAQDEPPSGSPTNFSRFSRNGENSTMNRSLTKNGENSTMNRSLTRLTEKQQILILNPDFVTLRSDLIEEEKFTPLFKIMALALMFSVLMFLNVMVGGGDDNYSPWDITCGSAVFWMMHLLMIVFLIASAWAASTYVVARQEIKDLVNFDYVTGDIKWDARSVLLYPAVFVSAGFFAGTLGIGGGVITVPIMLAMGVHPAVVGATSSAMILFTSLLSTSCYVVFGFVLRDYATLGFCIGFFAAIVGQNLMRQVRQATSASGRNFERNSYVAFAIGGIVLLSALLMTMEYVIRIVQQPDEDEGGLCEGLRF